ncbi:SWIM zinc finger family protein [Cohnella sp. REN36]|uniref:SWIM zinc finger family protein n=1 Tax=Cohnella sp. REN36 TaxID=2887347 RepID=UPI001D14693E|nr:SWIM zinc finger family protein [Cohnella sp. REN36]MCC3376704.1 SWIM zinc finger family protein [Cohnella sp. REN36]
MQPTYVMDDTQWQRLVQEAAGTFNDLTLKRGFQYYKQERVQRLRAAGPDEISGIVADEEPRLVELKLARLADSRCSCPQERGCKHLAAALMAYAERQGRPVNALANAGTAPAATRTAAPAGGKASVGLREEAARIPGLTAAEWRGLFARCVAPLAQETRNVQYAKEALAAIDRLAPPLSPATARFYALHALLFVLEEVLNPPRQTFWQQPVSSFGYHTHLAVSELHEAIAASLGDGPDLAGESDQRERLAETIAYLRERMLGDAADQADYFDFYDRLWRHWVRPNLTPGEAAPYEAEIRLLQDAEAGENDGPARAKLSRRTRLLAECLMRYALKDDEAAWALLRQADQLKIALSAADAYRFLSDLAESEDGPRLLAWLEATAPLLGHYQNRNQLGAYAAYWEQAARRLPEAEPRMWEALVRMLPYSGDIYEEKLRERGEWHRWIDYQISAGRDPLDFRAPELQPLEKEAPEALLPFYHHAVERYVAEKNRSSYKSATRLLKRLAKLYKKTKREPRWERFFEAFSARHSRLRALQEELRKGKLIP